MPRNMSFALTTEQFLAQTKDVTRRDGWTFLKPGDVLMGCRQCMGLKKGQQIERLGLIRVVNVRRELLSDITDAEVAREGFPGKSAQWFIIFWHLAHKIAEPYDHVIELTRIEFKYLDADPCNCQMSDAWRCAVDQNLRTVSCPCKCHKTTRTSDAH